MKLQFARNLLLKSTMEVFGQALRSELIKRKLSQALFIPNAISIVLETYEGRKSEINKFHTKSGRLRVAKKYCVSACFLMAILDVKPLRRRPTGTTISFVEKYLNAILAIQTAI